MKELNRLIDAFEYAVENVCKTNNLSRLKDLKRQREEARLRLQQYISREGVTLRDEFAMAALPTVYEETMAYYDRYGCPDPDWRDGVALGAYQMADSMIAVKEDEEGVRTGRRRGRDARAAREKGGENG